MQAAAARRVRGLRAETERAGGAVATKTLAVDEKRTRVVRRLETLAYLLDDSIPIPGTGARFGLDAVIGLIPGVGDAAGALMSCYIVLEAARLGAGFAVIMRMLLNLVIDTVLGAIPLIGDIFDATWKANDRNLRLLHRAVDAPDAARRSSKLFVLFVFLLLAALFAGTLALIWYVLQLVIHPASYGS
jgi:hypothetical protein